jgi:hypothetical protein
MVTVFMAGAISIQAQDEKLTRKEKKRLERKAEAEQKYAKTANLIDSMKFVLEANYLDNQRGNRIIVPTALNFIKVDSSDVVLQVGRNTGMGTNGVGGATAEGTISRYKVTKNDRNKSFDIVMNVSTNIGSYDVLMNVSSDGNARATISGMYPGKLVYEGDIVSLDESRIYKGRSL